MPTPAEVEAAAKALCFMNGVQECCDAGCTPETCEYGLRDFEDEARAALEAAERVRDASAE
jgi:hypothetical protein